MGAPVDMSMLAACYPQQRRKPNYSQAGANLAPKYPPGLDYDPNDPNSWPWVSPPPGFKPFDWSDAVPTPDNTGAEIEVLAFEVPRGYNGCIKGISNNYTGNSFVDGSGGLVWRILVDQRPYQNYGQIEVQFGSPSFPRPVSGGIIITSGQRIVYTVTKNDGGIPGTGTFICCSFSGYYWPTNG